MQEKNYALFGVIGPLVAYVFIGISIVLSPWFRWQENALSDLGHAVKSSVAPIFNFGLLLTGFLMAIYCVTVFRKYAKYTCIFLLISAFSLQLVAAFNEVYGFIHFAFSILFFVSIGISSITYFVERKSLISIIAFIMGLCSWMLYWANTFNAGVAVPETVSSVSVMSWVLSSALKIFDAKSLKIHKSPKL